MRIIIVGAGRMGFNLAQQLEREGHEVFIVENDLERLELVRTRLDVMAIQGTGVGMRSLRAAGVDDADLLIAVTNSDEVNLVACLLSRDMQIKRRIARVQSAPLIEELSDSEPGVLGVDEFFNPLQVTVDRLRQMVMTPGSIEFAEFAKGRVVLRALPIKPGSPLIAVPLSDLRARFSEPFVICAIKRGNDLIVPGGDFRLRENDAIYVVMRARILDAFRSTFELADAPTRRAMIIGGDRAGCALAAAIEEHVGDVILLEPDESLASRAAAQLSNTSVMRGSPLDKGLLEDLRISGIDLFLSTSDSDELNLSSALLAKRMGVPRVIMLTSEPAHVEIFESLPVDSVVSPLLLCVGAILRSVRGGRMRSLFKLAGGRGEAIEIEVGEASVAAGKPLRELELPAGIVVAAVICEDNVAIACGDTVVEPGSRVVVVTLREVWDSAFSIFSGDSSK